MSGVTVEVSARKVWFPFECPCCSGYPDTELQAKRSQSLMRRLRRRRSRPITVPYCRRCVAHTQRWSFAGRAANGTMAGAAVVGIALGYAGAIALAAIACAVGVVGGLAVKRWQRRAALAQSKHSCVQPEHAVTCLRRSRHGGEFSFASRRYAAKFAVQNARTLANVTPELLELIEQYRTRGDSAQLPACDASKERPSTDPGELDWLTAKPSRRSRPWWSDSSISGTGPTQVSV